MRSLTWKITLALIATSLLGVGFVAFFAGAFTRDRFDELRLAEERARFLTVATNYYETTGTLDGLSDIFQPVSDDFSSEEDAEAAEEPRNGRGENRQTQGNNYSWGRAEYEVSMVQFFLADADGEAVTRAPGINLGTTLPESVLRKGEPFTIDGEVVGTLVEVPQPPTRNDLEQQFFDEVNRGLVQAAIGVVLAASLVGITFARRLTTPLRQLTFALRSMEEGKLEQRVETRSSDEIGELIKSFNRMSAELSRANQLRRQMTADIAHDLRTPLSVIAGYLEALSDGTLPPTPERFNTLHNEATLLQRLVEDLRTLSLADAGELVLQKQEIDVQEFIEDVHRFYEPHAKEEAITLRTDIAPNLPTIQGDRMRLGQILGNLISNAIRHTPAEGVIALGAAREGESLQIWVQDTGEGIAPEKLIHVFDRLYRVDESRTQSSGQTGLGLAITRALVEAHGGTIRAESKVDKGTKMILSLPIAP